MRIVTLAAWLAFAGCGKDQATSSAQKVARPEPRASSQLEIFDAHLHYNHGSPSNHDTKPYYPLERVLELFRTNHVTGILANSTPNDGTRQLVDAKPAGLWVVPFVRPYREFTDYHQWFAKPSTIELIEAELARGGYRGIGELHVSGEDARTPIAKQVVEIAAKHDLVLHAHCDEPALEILFAHAPQIRIIWAHTGFDTSPERLVELFAKYPRLWGELSYQSGPTDGDGNVAPAWRALFEKHADRFLIGSDTWIEDRWADYSSIIASYRAWLVQLPQDQARKIAFANAGTLFGARTK